jgi:TP901 family phage tail tape measure protein
MTVQVGEAFIKIRPDTAGFSGELTPQVQRAGVDATRALQSATVGLVGVSAAFAGISRDYNGAVREIAAGTGATGDALQDLVDSAKTVGTQVPADLRQVGSVVADLNTALGLTGRPLEDLSRQILNLNRIGQTVNTQTLTRVFGDWGIAVEDTGDALDELFQVSQLTGPSVDRLGSLVVRYGAPLRAFGLGFQEAAVLLGNFEKAGVNTEIVMSGLRQALTRFAREQRDPQQALAETIAAIQNAGSAAEANSIAFAAFGAEAGVDLARAIQEGRFDIDELTALLETTESTINEVADSTTTWAERLSILRNRLVGVVGPFADGASAVSGFAASLAAGALSLQALGRAVPGAAGALRALPAALGPIAVGLAAITAAGIGVKQFLDDDFSLSVDSVALLRQPVENLVDAFQRFSSLRADAGLDLFRQTAEGSIERATELRDALVELGQDAEPLDRILADVASQNDNLARASEGAVDATGDQIDATDDLTSSLEDARQALDELIQTTIGSFDVETRYERAKIRSRDAIFRYNDALDRSNRVGGDSLEVLSELEGATLDVRDAITGQARDYVELNDQTLDTIGGQQLYREELQRVANSLAPGSPVRVALDEYIAALDETAGTRSTTFIADTSAAIAAINDLRRRYDQISNIFGILPTPRAPAPAPSTSTSGTVQRLSGSTSVYNINVNNPVGEPTETSLTRELQRSAYLSAV